MKALEEIRPGEVIRPLGQPLTVFGHYYCKGHLIVILHDEEGRIRWYEDENVLLNTLSRSTVLEWIR